MQAMLLSCIMLFNTTACTKKEETVVESTEEETKVHIVFSKPVDTDSYVKDLGQVETHYKFPEYYLTGYDVVLILNDLKSYQTCDNVDKYDLNMVYDQILKNSDFVSSEDETIKEVVEALEIALQNSYLADYQANDDFCKLMDVKIKISKINDASIANFSNKDNLLTIDYQKNKEISEKNNISIIEQLAATLEHEINHVRQYICSCRKQKGQKNSSIIYTPLLALNSFIEASAESLRYYQDVNVLNDVYTSTYDYSYSNNRKGQAQLLLMGMLKPNFSLKKYYQAILDADLREIFLLFNFENKENLISFYNVAISLDTLNGKNGLRTYFEEKGCYSFKDLQGEMGYSYKIDILKVYTADLINRINIEQFTILDSLKLYCYAKTILLEDVSNSFMVDGNIHYFYSEELLNSFTTIDEIFYSFLQKKYGVTREFIEHTLISEDFNASMNYLGTIYEIFEDKNIILKNKHLRDKFPIMNEINYNISLANYNDLLQFNQAKENGFVLEKK